MRSRTWRQRAECWRTARLLQRHLDGELGLLRTAEVGAHLRRCRRCGMEAETYRALRATLLVSRADEAAEEEAVERLGRFAAQLASTGDDGTTDRVGS